MRSYLAVALILSPSLVWAQEEAKCAENTAFVTFDHAAKPEIMSASLKLKDKEKFRIRVINTEPEQFTYRVTGAEAVPQPRGAIKTLNASATYEECVRHSERYGGYLMRVERKVPQKPEEKPKDDISEAEQLANKLFIVHVETDSWNYEVSGGFSLTLVPDKIYALSPVAEGQFRVIEDEGDDKESDARPGVASIITVFHSRRPRIGISFGLGINEGASATYYLGPTWRLGNVAGITGGIAWGPVTRLPDGVNVDDIVSDVNLLNTKHTRTASAAFICISYSFLGSLDTLKKPFAGQ